MKKIKGILSLALAAVLIITSGGMVLADGVDMENAPYLALGADLSETEKAKVLELLEVNADELGQYNTIEITNQDEHDYLDQYLSASIIGSRALSSVLVEKQEEGYGITVNTYNITYCTPGMYTNALVTAGIKDAEVTVAGPFDITGTAALVGAMKAYSVMTGESISEETMDTAVNELVVTGEIAENTGDTDKTEQLIAIVKEKVFDENLATSEDIENAVRESAKALDLELSEEDIASIVDLMNKISEADVDVEAIKAQAKELYDKFENIDTEGLADKVGGFFSNIFTAISDFFTGLFEK